jgi:hypothetical protein
VQERCPLLGGLVPRNISATASASRGPEADDDLLAFSDHADVEPVGERDVKQAGCGELGGEVVELGVGARGAGT